MLLLHHRCKDGRKYATMWPYPRDATYFRMLAIVSILCWLAIFAIEAYAIWFVVYANENGVRDKFGVLGEYNWGTLCRTRHASSASTRTLSTAGAAAPVLCRVQDVL